MLQYVEIILCRTKNYRPQLGTALALCLGAVIVLGGCAAPEPTVSMSAEPSSIERGKSTTLKWSSENATSASLNQEIGAVSVSDSREVSPTQSITYQITVKGEGAIFADPGEASASAQVTVREPPPPPPPAPPEPEIGVGDYRRDTPWVSGAEGKLMLGLDGGSYEPYRKAVVRDAQVVLFRQELYEGLVTGVLDEQTMEAVAELQRKHGILNTNGKASGVLTPKTREALKAVSSS
jgi:peptidoglycan hydrolase-like protein with peptidoglycan-binding domain